MPHSPSLRLLASLPVPDATWEPIEPQTQPDHHARGILRFTASVRAVGRLDEAPASPWTGVERR